MTYIPKKSGKTYSSFQQYIDSEIEPAFDRIRKYVKVDLKNPEAERKIKDRDSLLKFLDQGGVKGSSTFVKDIEQTNTYEELIVRNQREDKREELPQPRGKAIVVPQRRVYYQKLSKRELISRRSAMRKEMRTIEAELNRRKRATKKKA